MFGIRLFAVIALFSSAAMGNELSLAKKAEIFQHDMESRFLLEGQALCKLKLPQGDRDFVAYNMPDNAYMTGMYLGALCMKYAVTQDPADKAKAAASLAALNRICTISGVPGLWTRAFWPVDKPMDDDGVWRESADGKYRWRGDVSTDQVDGVLFGLSWAYGTIADESEKTIIRKNVTDFVEYVLKNDLVIVGYDGKPTEWGKYNIKYVRVLERMNALLWLQALKIASHVTGEARYGDLYRQYAIDEGYGEIAILARHNFDPASRRVNHSDDVLQFLAYEPLLRLEKDPEIRAFYEKSLARSYKGSDGQPGMAPEGNPFFTYVAARYIETSDLGVPEARNFLAWFPFDLKWNRDTIAQYAAKFDFTPNFEPQSPPAESGAAVPVDRREKSWSAFVMNPYRPAVESRAEDSPVEYNGHDYLLGYWTGRYYGFIHGEE